MMNLRKKVGLAALLAFGTVGAANAGYVVLDTFDYTPTVDLEVNVATTSVAAIRNDINAFNADVQYTLDYISGPSQLDSSAVSFEFMGDGVLSYSNDDFMVSQLTMTYGAFDGTPASPLDLTIAGSSAFYFDILSSDLGFDVDIIVGSNGGADLSTYGSTSTAVSSLTRDTVNFADFNTLAGIGADFASVDFVSIFLTTTAVGSDLTITEFGIASVPEPTTVALFGLALVGFGLSTKRKAK